MPSRQKKKDTHAGGTPSTPPVEATTIPSTPPPTSKRSRSTQDNPDTPTKWTADLFANIQTSSPTKAAKKRKAEEKQEANTIITMKLCAQMKYFTTKYQSQDRSTRLVFRIIVDIDGGSVFGLASFGHKLADYLSENLVLQKTYSFKNLKITQARNGLIATAMPGQKTTFEETKEAAHLQVEEPNDVFFPTINELQTVQNNCVVPLILGRVAKIFKISTNFMLFTLDLPGGSNIPVKIFGSDIPTDKKNTISQSWPVEETKILLCFNLYRNDYEGKIGFKLTPQGALFDAEQEHFAQLRKTFPDIPINSDSGEDDGKSYRKIDSLADAVSFDETTKDDVKYLNCEFVLIPVRFENFKLAHTMCHLSR